LFKSRVSSMCVRLVVIAAAFAAACLVSAPGAQAVIKNPPGGSCSWTCVANEVVFLDPSTNGTGYYFDVKAVPNWAKHYNFGFDGCSLPAWLHKALGRLGLDDNAATYAKFFRPSCRIHDFGYRNFGKGPYKVTAGDSTDPRKSVDDRFHTLMNRKCGHNPPSVPAAPDDLVCKKVAGVFYQAVRKFGASHW
jgi:hypothetical protein